jgi:hypothetical protein
MQEQDLSLDAFNYLETLSAEELLNLPNTWLNQQNEKLFWRQACQKFYQLIPIAGQKPLEVFWSEYIYRKSQVFKADSPGCYYLLLTAAQYNNFNALATLSQQAINQKDFDHALLYAEKASQVYGTPGHLLVSSVYRELSQQYNNGSANAKRYAQQGLNYLNLAIAAAQESSVAMQSTRCILDAKKLAHFRQEFIQKGQLTAAEIAVSEAHDEPQLVEH